MKIETKEKIRDRLKTFFNYAITTLAIGGGIFALTTYFGGCDSYQRMVYTADEGETSISRNVELCFKSEKNKNAAGGGNTLHLDNKSGCS